MIFYRKNMKTCHSEIEHNVFTNESVVLQKLYSNNFIQQSKTSEVLLLSNICCYVYYSSHKFV